jgi:hypothetical protein
MTNRIVEDIAVICLIKGSERYVWLYSDNDRVSVLRAFGRYASNPELSLTWHDVAVLSQKVRRGTGRDE